MPALAGTEFLPKNDLKQKVLSTKISVVELVRMTSKEMASNKVKKIVPL